MPYTEFKLNDDSPAVVDDFCCAATGDAMEEEDDDDESLVGKIIVADKAEEEKKKVHFEDQRETTTKKDPFFYLLSLLNMKSACFGGSCDDGDKKHPPVLVKTTEEDGLSQSTNSGGSQDDNQEEEKSATGEEHVEKCDSEQKQTWNCLGSIFPGLDNLCGTRVDQGLQDTKYHSLNIAEDEANPAVEVPTDVVYLAFFKQSEASEHSNLPALCDDEDEEGQPGSNQRFDQISSSSAAVNSTTSLDEFESLDTCDRLAGAGTCESAEDTAREMVMCFVGGKDESHCTIMDESKVSSDYNNDPVVKLQNFASGSFPPKESTSESDVESEPEARLEIIEETMEETTSTDSIPNLPSLAVGVEKTSDDLNETVNTTTGGGDMVDQKSSVETKSVIIKTKSLYVGHFSLENGDTTGISNMQSSM